jgi:CHASE2 domain-containing sensor protein
MKWLNMQWINKIKTVILIFIAFKAIVFLAYLAYEHLPIQLIHFEHFAIEDVEFNDIYYSTRGIGDKILLQQKEVILINTGSLPADSFRLKTAELIRKLAIYRPAAIGIDHFFEKDKDSSTDSILGAEISRQSNIVLATDKLSHHQKFSSKYQGIVNLPISDNNKETVREYYNYIVEEKDTIFSFALQLAKLKQPALQVSKSLEYLRYSCVSIGYYNVFDKPEGKDAIYNFPAIEAKDILTDRDTSKFRCLMENKIIILGHLGRDSMFLKWDFEDKYMVPTDSNLMHRRLLMPGAVIHANAVQAMLNDDHLLEMKGFRYELITDIILILFLVLFYTMQHSFMLHKAINLLIILASTIPIIFILGPWLMSVGIYYHTGTLFLQIAFLEEFLEVADGFKNKFIKWKRK